MLESGVFVAAEDEFVEGDPPAKAHASADAGVLVAHAGATVRVSQQLLASIAAEYERRPVSRRATADLSAETCLPCRERVRFAVQGRLKAAPTTDQRVDGGDGALQAQLLASFRSPLPLYSANCG